MVSSSTCRAVVLDTGVVVVVVSLVKDGSSTVMLLMTLFTPESNKKSCPEKMFIIEVARCREVPEEEAPGGHMWLTTDIRPGRAGGGEGGWKYLAR